MYLDGFGTQVMLAQGKIAWIYPHAGALCLALYDETRQLYSLYAKLIVDGRTPPRYNPIQVVWSRRSANRSHPTKSVNGNRWSSDR